MSPKTDYYETLGVKRGAKSDEIRKSFKRLARKYHPDLNPGDKASEERFKQIQEAYSILTDPKKKKMYDQLGFYSENAQSAGAGGYQQGPDRGPGFDFGGFDFSKFTGGGPGGAEMGGENPFTGVRGSQGGGFGDIFGQFFSGRGGRKAQPKAEPGADLEYALNIDFWQAIEGLQIRLNVNRQSPCAQCNGSGSAGRNKGICPECGGGGTVSQMAGAMRFNITCPRCNGSGQLRNACPACRGEGRTVSKETVEVRIPPGVPPESRLRVPGKGNAGSLGAPSGDLYITVRVEPHPFFERKGNDIHIEMPVSVWEASLGTKIEVPTIDGRALLKIPQGTENGQKFRLREKGVLNARTGVRGDQIVVAKLLSLPARDERTREILRELAELHDDDPRADIWTKVKRD